MDVWTLRRHVRELNLWLREHPVVLRIVECIPSGWGLVLRRADGTTGCLELHLDGEKQGFLWNPSWVETPAESALGRAMHRRLADARAGEAQVLGYDRVVHVPFQRRDRLFGSIERSALILECTGRVANLLLVDEHREIIEQARLTANNRPKTEYQPISSDLPELNPLNLDPDAGRKILALPSSEWRHDLPWLSPVLCRELEFRLGHGVVDPVRVLIDLIGELEGNRPVSVVWRDAKVRAISTAELRHLADSPRQSFATVNEALIWIDRELIEARRDRELRGRALGHFRKRLLRLEQAIAEEQTRLAGFDQAETWRHQGDLLLANAHAIPARATEARVLDWDTSAEIVIPLDPEATVAYCARRLFQRYKKALRGQEEGRKRLQTLEREAAWVREQIWFCEHAAGAAELHDLLPSASKRRRPTGSGDGRKDARERQESKRISPALELDGCRFYVGRNGRQNDLITFRIGRRGDLWCHANDVPGAHVVARRADGPVTDEDTHRGAVLAAYFSFARQGGKVRVDVTDIAHVKRIPGGDPGRVSYTHQRTLTVDPLEAESWLTVSPPTVGEKKTPAAPGDGG
ncbi:MAG TPA: NFACT family protein [Candidatus Ozemobacteraceae bacterium]|nr:NFACT family protein [Candidatus Ozemobacteraceae bacterium]